jgi:hypothetical protein
MVLVHHCPGHASLSVVSLPSPTQPTTLIPTRIMISPISPPLLPLPRNGDGRANRSNN